MISIPKKYKFYKIKSLKESKVFIFKNMKYNIKMFQKYCLKTKVIFYSNN